MSIVTELKIALQRAARDVPAPGWTVRLEYVTGAYGVELHAERPGFARQVFSTRYARIASAEAFAAWLRACLAEVAALSHDSVRAPGAPEHLAGRGLTPENTPAGFRPARRSR